MKKEHHESTLVINVLSASILLVAICFLPRNVSAAITMNSIPINTNAEYTNGTMPAGFGDIWYDWVNTSKTQIIYYVLYSNTVNSPIINFLGQHFQVENGTEVFVGSTMAMIEVYTDTNGDGIPQANFTSGVTEIQYYLLMNSSASYHITNIQKTQTGEISHYLWGFEYETIDAFLLYPEQQPGHAAAKVIIDHVGLGYDFSVENNVSSLKTSFDIGEITNVQSLPDEPQVSLDGLSLSLLFSTITVAAKPYAVHINGQPYNSTTTSAPAIATNLGEVTVNMVKAFDFVFGETYNLTRGGNTETHEVKSEAAATSSVPQSALSDMDWVLYVFEDKLNFTELFGTTWGRVNLNCNASALLYRICYPVWDGLAIQHDPTYVAYLFSNTQIPEFTTLTILLTLSATTAIAATTARFYKRKRINVAT